MIILIIFYYFPSLASACQRCPSAPTRGGGPGWHGGGGRNVFPRPPVGETREVPNSWPEIAILIKLASQGQTPPILLPSAHPSRHSRTISFPSFVLFPSIGLRLLPHNVQHCPRPRAGLCRQSFQGTILSSLFFFPFCRSPAKSLPQLPLTINHTAPGLACHQTPRCCSTTQSPQHPRVPLCRPPAQGKDFQPTSSDDRTFDPSIHETYNALVWCRCPQGLRRSQRRGGKGRRQLPRW